MAEKCRGHRTVKKNLRKALVRGTFSGWRPLDIRRSRGRVNETSKGSQPIGEGGAVSKLFNKLRSEAKAPVDLTAGSDQSSLWSSEEMPCILNYAGDDKTEHVLRIIHDDPKAVRQQNEATGWSLLHVAARRNNLILAKELISLDPTLTRITDRSGCNALRHAAECADLTFVRMLLAADASGVRHIDKHGQFPMAYAIQDGRDDIVAAMLDSDPQASFRRDGMDRLPDYYNTGINLTRRMLITRLLSDCRRGCSDAESGRSR